MSEWERFQLFGNPTELLVAEAVWTFHEENEAWPKWQDAIAELQELAECDATEADARITQAIQAEEVSLVLSDEDREWHLTLDQATADRITRRYLHMTMQRDREESF